MSLPTQGNFDCAALQVILAKADEIFTDDIRKSEYIAHVDSALAVIQNQTARFQELENTDKDREIKVWWVDDCDTEPPGDCSDDCVIGGDEAGANCQTYALSQCIEKDWKVTRKQFRGLGMELEDVMAIQMLKKMKLMDEAVNRSIIQHMDLYSGVNQYVGEFTQVANLTYVPPAAWNEDFFGWLNVAGQLNEMGNTKLLSGVNLYRLMLKLRAEGGNADGKGALAKMSGFEDAYFDLFSLDLTIGDKATFLFNPNSLAHVGKTYNDGTPRVRQNPWQLATTVQSYNIPQLKYDLFYMPTCSSNDWTDAWRLQYHFDNFQNPIGCNSEKTGIVQIRCGTGS